MPDTSSAATSGAAATSGRNQLAASQAGAPFLAVADLSKTFETRRRNEISRLHVLDEITFSAADGEFVAILGPSGCGKSTILNAVAGLTSYDGEIVIGGTRVDGPGPDRAMVFQHASLLPWRSCLQNVMFGMKCHGQLDSAQMNLVARQVLERLGLSEFIDHYPSQLSGGMQQRVNIARALAVDPQLILMDEPFGALDALTREQLQDQLATLMHREQRATLFVTHDIGEAAYLADKILVMAARPGRVVDEVAVPLARPRVRAMTESTAFDQTVRHLRDLLRPDATSTAQDSFEKER